MKGTRYKVQGSRPEEPKKLSAFASITSTGRLVGDLLHLLLVKRLERHLPEEDWVTDLFIKGKGGEVKKKEKQGIFPRFPFRFIPIE